MSTAEQIIAALEPYKLKRDGANKYRCHSPLRPGSDSHAFTKNTPRIVERYQRGTLRYLIEAVGVR